MLSSDKICSSSESGGTFDLVFLGCVLRFDGPPQTRKHDPFIVGAMSRRVSFWVRDYKFSPLDLGSWAALFSSLSYMYSTGTLLHWLIELAQTSHFSRQEQRRWHTLYDHQLLPPKYAILNQEITNCTTPMIRLPEFVVRQPTVSVVVRNAAAVTSTIKSSTTTTTTTTTTARMWKQVGAFPVRRVYCVGRNYEAHAIEMGHTLREPPFFFGKPSHCIVDTFAGGVATDDNDKLTSIPYPMQTQNFHFEGELVVALGERDNLSSNATSSIPTIYGYALGCDLTRRDLQALAKDKGHPWETAKAFDDSAPCGPIVSLAPHELSVDSILSLSVNGTIRQSAPLNHMIWSVSELLQELPKSFTLHPGDLIFTGTPAGVGPLQIGDTVSIECGPLPPCQFRISETR